MKLAVFGGTGMVGRHIVSQALQRGHEVVTLARSPEKLSDFADRITIVEGDYFAPADQQKILAGADAVLSTIGPLPGKKDTPPAEAFGQAMGALVTNMEAQGIRKIRTVSGAATSFPGEKIVLPRKIMRLMMRFMGPVVAPAKEAELAALMASNLDYVVTRPPMIKEDLEGTLVAHNTEMQGMKVSAQQLAGFMLDTLENDDWARTQPFVGTK